jgi:hypothetical protein
MHMLLYDTQTTVPIRPLPDPDISEEYVTYATDFTTDQIAPGYTEDAVRNRLRKLIFPWRPWRTLDWYPVRSPRQIHGVNLTLVGHATFTRPEGTPDYQIAALVDADGVLAFDLVGSAPHAQADSKPCWSGTHTFQCHESYRRALFELRCSRMFDTASRRHRAGGPRRGRHRHTP